MHTTLTGSCQCGHVRYELTKPFIDQVACHCFECQKMSATSFGISALIERSGFNLLSGSLTLFKRIAESGNENHCFFCSYCGNRIYHVNPNQDNILRIKPGTLNDTSSIKPTTHFWVKHKQSWVDIPKQHKQYQTQPSM